ncbi:DUF2345 domain-containing protein [Pseudoduganella albidiflava]|uniref:DUF2345 domain-containing protein n=1 Tax=Pseudoduganella albidiflava TaxID=321983 RepID=UPI0021A3405B|nr:DUF2345 domain-containing protein [Pseudoduganella albidiflava]
MLALIDPEEKGKHEGAVNGQEALKAKQGARDLDGSAPVEKFGAPLVVMDSTSTVNWASPASTVLFAGEQLQWSTQSDLHLAAAHTVSSVSAEATGLYTYEGGVQAFAGNGPVSLQAHTDQLEILADKEVIVISVNDCIEIKAKQKIVLQAGQSSVTLDGSNITFACPGNFTVKGGKHIFDEAGRQVANLAMLPGELQTEQNWIALHYLESDGTVGISGAEYEIHFEAGPVLTGKLDEHGKAHHDNVERKRVKKVIYKPRAPDPEKPTAPLEDLMNG